MAKQTVATLVLANGMMRSGSTWLYNAARLILGASVDLTCGLAVDVTDYTGTVLLKTHEVGRELLARADVVLYSYRDIRDVLASRFRFMGTVPTMGAADRLIAECDTIEPIADYAMRYESMILDPLTEVELIAGAVDARVDASAVVSELDELRRCPVETDNGKPYDALTLYHPGHVTDGRHMSFAGQLPSEFVGNIQHRHAGWLERHGYPLAEAA